MLVLVAILKKYPARYRQAWADETRDALATQTVTVTGTNATTIVIPHLATTLNKLYRQRATIKNPDRGTGE